MNKQNFKVCLDAGHGGRDPGAVGNGLQEKDLTLTLALMTRDLLRTVQGIEVIMTRDSDVFVPIGTRVRIANEARASVFISIHINGFDTPNAHGFEVYARTNLTEGDDSLILKRALYEKLAPTWIAEGRISRGKKKAGYQVIQTTRMAAVLIEHGFISNPLDAALLKDRNFIEGQATAIRDALVEYAGITPIAKAKQNSLYRVSNENGQVGAFGGLDNAMNKARALLESGAKRVLIENR